MSSSSPAPDGARIDVVRRAPFGDNPQVGERGTDTERRIREAGLEVFAQHGYHGARVELISEAAGCSRPAFYQYFSSKEDLFWRLADSFAVALGRLAAGIAPSTPDEDGLASVAAWFEELVDVAVENLALMTTFQAALRDQPPGGLDHGRIGTNLGTAVLASADVGDHPPALANVVAGVAMRSIYYWRLGIGGVSRPRFVDGVARTLHRVLHGPIAGVNVVDTTRPPSRRPPRWPEPPTDDANGLPTRARGRQTRRTLLDATRTVLLRRGYHATRVDDIAAEAGVSHGTFYRYFANTDDVFQALAQEAGAEQMALVAAFPDSIAEPELRTWLDEWFDCYAANGGVISAWQELDHDDPALAGYSFDIAVVFFDRLVRIVHGRDFGDPTVDAILLLSLVERVPFNAVISGHIDVDESLEAATIFIRRGVFGLT